MSGLLKLAKLHLVVPTTSATNMWLLSAMKRIKNDRRNSTTENRLNHCMILHAYFKETDQVNMIEVAKGLTGDN